MTSVLLSIRPKYVEKIVDGTKKYEFRRTIFKQSNVDRLFIYSTSPVRKLIGAFDAGEIVEGSPKQIWSRCRRFSGVDSDTFFDYFHGRHRAYAIGIDKLALFEEPIDPKDYMTSFVPPQSFCYMDEALLRQLNVET